MPARIARRAVVALAAVLASATAVVVIPLAATPASAADGDTWSVPTPYAGTATVLDDGSVSGNPAFSYFYCSQPGGTQTSCTDGGAGSHSWTFEATASTAETVTGSYDWNGFHAFFDVYADLSAFVTSGGVTTTTPILSAGPESCCTTPSAGFDYAGQHTFSNLLLGDTYGFVVSGSNADSNSQLRGTFNYATSVVQAPTPPSNLAAQASAGQVALTWTAPTSGAPSGYEVLAGTSSGGETLDENVTTNGTTAVATALPDGSALLAGTTYYFTVEAVNGGGPSAPSNEAQAVAEGFAANTSWLAARSISLTGSGTGASGTATPAQSIDEPGEALWYDFAIAPDEQVQACLTNVPADYGVALFSDIGQTFQDESSTPSLATLGAETPGNASSPSAFSPSAFSPSAFSPSAFSPSAFSPSAFSPSAFSPSAFSPSAFSPSAFSPSAFSPSAFSPSAFSPSAFSPSAFSAAYSAAQLDSLLAVSTVPGAVSKCVDADTWNNTGNFYVRVTGNNGADAPGATFGLTVTTSGAVCPTNLSSFSSDATISGSGSPQTVIVDNSKLMAAAGSGGSLYAPLQSLAAATNGVVVDASQSQRVLDLTAQAQSNPTCPYAENLVAAAIQDIVNSYRSASLEYVVIVGDDDVIPYFRYPDNSGLAPESGYEPPLSSTSAAGAALASNQYLSDDQYGAASELTYQGTTVPLVTAAVGRLVETPSDILATIASYLANPTIEPSSSLVTGYDFMQPPADQVEAALAAGLPGGTNDTLISQQGTPPTSSWTATDLAGKLFGSHHDLVFLGGHFSANNLLAADDSTTLTTNQFASQVGTSLANSLVLAAGCHAGYNIDPADGVPGVTDGLAWPQAFTEAGATLIAGTGYQYGDTNYVAYSDQVYVDLAQQLGYTPATGSAVAVGTALLDAKLEYLAGLDRLTGLEEKALLEISLYGLPMLGVQEPNQAPAPAGTQSTVTPSALTTGPGQPGPTGLGLSEGQLDVTTSTTPAPGVNFLLTPKSVTPAGSGTTYTYDSGPQGVVADPAGPVLPVGLYDVNGGSSGVLRGVGFWGGTYADTPGTNPLTGDPATETGNPNVVPFASPVMFPQTLWNPNFFPTLTEGGDTELAVTPVQYASDPGGAATDTMRAYSDVELNLYYSANNQSYTGTRNGLSYTDVPALAAPPTISDVTSSAAGDQVTVTATVTGDPSAGIQDVWVSYTGAGSLDPLYGSWQSVHLTQDATSSTQWTGTFADAGGNPSVDARFIVQAVNGVGEVSMDNNDGAFFTPTFTPGAPASPSANTYSLTLGGETSGGYQTSASVTATLAPLTGQDPNVAGQAITFGLDGTTVAATTGAGGVASATIPLIMSPGTYTLGASYAGDAADAPAATSTPFQTTPDSTSLALSVPAAQLVAGQDNGITATLTTPGGPGSLPLPERSVFFVISDATGPVLTTSGITNAAGVAEAGVLDVPAADTGTNGTGDTITAYFGGEVPLPGGGRYDASDPDYAGATSSGTSVGVTAPPAIKISAPSTVPATGPSTTVGYQVTVVNYDGSPGSATCTPASGSGFPLGSTTISCSASDGFGNTAKVTASIDVEPAPLGLSISGVQSYGGSPSWKVTMSGLVGGDSASVITGSLSCTTSPATSSASAPGSYPISSCSGLDIPSYYAATYQYGDLTIGAAPLTVTASSATVTYGEAPPAVTPSYAGLVNGDTPASLATAPACTTTATQSSQPGSYATTCSGAVDPNYSPISYVPGTLTVTPSTLLLLGNGAGTLALSGEPRLGVHGSVAVDAPGSGAVTLTGQSVLTASGALVSPASPAVLSKGESRVSVASYEVRPAELDPDAGLPAPSTSGMTVYSSARIEGPGVYTHAVAISGESEVKLASGIYIFEDGLAISGESRLTSLGGGVLLYLAGGGLSVSGESRVSVAPLGSGTYQGVGLFEAPTDNQAVLVAGESRLSLVGLLYAPSADLALSGEASSAAGTIVADSMTLAGQSAAVVG